MAARWRVSHSLPVTLVPGPWRRGAALGARSILALTDRAWLVQPLHGELRSTPLAGWRILHAAALALPEMEDALLVVGDGGRIAIAGLDVASQFDVRTLPLGMVRDGLARQR